MSVSVNITGKRRFIHSARRSDNYTGDTDDKQRLIDILRDHFGIHSITAEPILLSAKRCIIPDVVTTDYDPLTYFELHGRYHGLPDVPSQYTLAKRDKYADLGLKCIEIWEEDTDDYNKKKIIDLLYQQGLRPQ